jgi:ribonuclease T
MTDMNDIDMTHLNAGDNDDVHAMAKRFRGFLPIVIDIETSGFNNQTDALLELSGAILDMNEEGELVVDKIVDYVIKPFAGANLDKAALEFNGIDPHDPKRQAISEEEALELFFQQVRKAVKRYHCTRAIVVAHNAHFDHGFLMAAAERCDIKRNPFHPFSCFDTVSLAGLAYGQTVLAKACEAAGIPFSNKEAHTSHYDTEKTAVLFCKIVNLWRQRGGWL